MAVRYRWMICDLLTDTHIIDLPLKVDSYDHRINQAGVISGGMPIPNQRVNRMIDKVVPRDEADLTTGPGRLVLHCIRQADGVPDDLWGSYWLWHAKITQGRKGPPRLDVRGMSLDGYFQQVEMEAVFERTGVNRIQIARDLLTDAQGLPHAGLGITLQTGTAGPAQDLIVKPGDRAKYGEQLGKLADQDGGFEHRINTRLTSGGGRVREWKWGYPRLGSESTQHDFAQPGNVLEWGEEWDATRGGTRFRSRGDSVTSDITAESVPQMSPFVEAGGHLAAGWPRLDRTRDYPGERDASRLAAYATYWAETGAGAVRVHSVTVRLGDNPSFTPHHLGDYATIRLVNQRYPRLDGVASFVRSWRVIGMSIKPPSRGNGVEEAELLFEETIA
ncbi:hypothetical protein GCM10017673_56320 [Streptosporangium violaceochromogenes]|nr:hypothetical protein GCM10017673_56320 [Streptosporangium violaceochromogenes]